MIEWRDQGTILAVRPHGETSAIVEALTAAHGRHAGVVLGGVSRRVRPFLQPGVEVDLAWRARLEDHLGHFTVEPVRNRAATGLLERLPLAAIGAVTALLLEALPEREPHPGLHARTAALLDLLDDPARDAIWPLAYLRWEVALLEEMGFGLDLASCAVTGARDDLAFISPRTGRAVSRGAAGEWADRLLPLPAVLLGREAGEVGEGLRVTGHFLPRLLPEGRPLPPARERLVDLLSRA